MPVTVQSRFPAIIAEAAISAHDAITETTDEIKTGAEENLTAHGSVKSGALFRSLHEDDGTFEGEVSAGDGMEDPDVALYVELGTGGRGARYQFLGKPEGIDYSRGIAREETSSWRGIPKNPDPGFAYLIPALEDARPEFYARCEGIYR